MKTIVILATLATIAVVLGVPIGTPNGFSTPSVGWAFSGAGSRIAQQAALAQTLYNTSRIIPSVISGVSSGALSVVGLNGALEYIYSNGSRGWSIGRWNDFIFNLRDSSVYKTGIRGAISTVKDLDDGYILDNSPLVDTLNNALAQIGYTNFGDLFLPSWITTVDQRTGQNLRLLSTDPRVANIPLIQILMATTAIPTAFQPRPIPALTNNTLFIDGGTGIDYLPVIPLIDGSNVSTIYAFLPNQDQNNGKNGDNDSLENNGIIRNTLKAYEIRGTAITVGDLAILANSAATGYVYSAVLNRTFSTLNFDNEKEQFDLTAAWASQHQPTLLTNARAFDFDTVLPSYYTNMNDAYNTNNDNSLLGDDSSQGTSRANSASATQAFGIVALIAAIVASLL